MFKPSSGNAGGNAGSKSDFEVGAVQREMVQTAFKDTLRATGVPAAFLSCEWVQRVNADGATQVEIRLVIKKWGGQLLRYSMAFQNQMRTCLDRYEPHIDHSAYEWLWQYAEDCANPYPHMPAPEEWSRKKDTATKANAAAKGSPTIDIFERRKVPRAPKSIK